METLFNDLVKAFGWSILNSIWQSGIIYFTLLLILLSAPKLTSKARHNLSYMAICAMCGWFLITFFNHLSVYSTAAGIPDGSNFSTLGFYLEQLPLTFNQRAEGYFPLLVSVYMTGILIQLFIIIKGYLFLRKLKTKQLSEVPLIWNEKFQGILRVLNIQRDIKFKISGLVSVPVVVGYLKPIVLFPVSLITQLDNDQIEAVLIHELSHIRRNDYLLNLIKIFIETLLFFNPFVWLASRFIHIEREHACDDLVLKTLGKPLTYAHALLKLELIKEHKTPVYALAATGKQQYLYQRIKRITNMKTNYLNTKQQLAALTLAVAGLLSVAWVNPEIKEKATDVAVKITNNALFQSEVKNPAEKITTPIDTGKKKHKMKIVITEGEGSNQVVVIDSKGNEKEYSLSELPDSIKIKLDGVKMSRLLSFDLKNDSNYKFRDLLLRNNKTTFLNLPHDFKFDRLSKSLNSPEGKLRLEQLKKDMEKFNSPEWKKTQEDLFKSLSSTKWQKLNTDSMFKSLSLDSNIRVMIQGNQHSRRMLDSIFRTNAHRDKRLMDIYKNLNKTTNQDMLSAANKIKDLKISFLELNRAKQKETLSFDRHNSALQNSEEYKKLKQKFEKEVEALKKKYEKKQSKN